MIKLIHYLIRNLGGVACRATYAATALQRRVTPTASPPLRIAWKPTRVRPSWSGWQSLAVHAGPRGAPSPGQSLALRSEGST